MTLEEYNKNPEQFVKEAMELSLCYNSIMDYYGKKTTKRSGVKLMNHIDEGLKILSHLNASTAAKGAFCLHPIFQGDDCIVDAMDTKLICFSQEIIALVMEYRHVANSYLCRPLTDHYTMDHLSAFCPLNVEQVKLMLIADKIQNRKDFELYHKGVHARSNELDKYFKQWLEYLGVDEDMYTSIASTL